MSDKSLSRNGYGLRTALSKITALGGQCPNSRYRHLADAILDSAERLFIHAVDAPSDDLRPSHNPDQKGTEPPRPFTDKEEALNKEFMRLQGYVENEARQYSDSYYKRLALSFLKEAVLWYRRALVAE